MQQAVLNFANEPAATSDKPFGRTPRQRAKVVGRHKPEADQIANRAAAAAAWLDEPVTAFERWLRTCRGGRGFSDKSRVVYLAMWRKYVTATGSLNSAAADDKTLETFLERVSFKSNGSEASPSQQRRYLSLIALVQDELMAAGLLNRNAARELLQQFEATAKKPPIALTLPQTRRLRQLVASQVAACSREESAKTQEWVVLRDAAIVEIFLGAGIKVSEMRELTLSSFVDTNIDSASLRVQVDGIERLVPIDVASLPILRMWHREMTKLGGQGVDPLFFSSDLAGRTAFDLDLVFELRKQSMLIDPKASLGLVALSHPQIWRIVDVALRRAGVTGHQQTGPNILRNTFAFRALHAGRSLEEVSEWVGHKEIGSTAALWEALRKTRSDAE